MRRFDKRNVITEANQRLEREYIKSKKNLLKEDDKGKDLLGALKGIHGKLTDEKFNVAPLQTGRDFSDEIKNRVANNPKLAGVSLNENELNEVAPVLPKKGLLKSLGFDKNAQDIAKKVLDLIKSGEVEDIDFGSIRGFVQEFGEMIENSTEEQRNKKGGDIK